MVESSDKILTRFKRDVTRSFWFRKLDFVDFNNLIYLFQLEMELNKKRGKHAEKDPSQFILSDGTVIKQAFEHSEESRDEMIHDSGLFIIDQIAKFRGVTLKQLFDALNSKILYDQLDSENKCSDLVVEHHTSMYKTFNSFPRIF